MKNRFSLLSRSVITSVIAAMGINMFGAAWAAAETAPQHPRAAAPVAVPAAPSAPIQMDKKVKWCVPADGALQNPKALERVYVDSKFKSSRQCFDHLPTEDGYVDIETLRTAGAHHIKGVYKMPEEVQGGITVDWSRAFVGAGAGAAVGFVAGGFLGAKKTTTYYTVPGTPGSPAVAAIPATPATAATTSTVTTTTTTVETEVKVIHKTEIVQPHRTNLGGVVLSSQLLSDLCVCSTELKAGKNQRLTLKNGNTVVVDIYEGKNGTPILYPVRGSGVSKSQLYNLISNATNPNAITTYSKAYTLSSAQVKQVTADNSGGFNMAVGTHTGSVEFANGKTGSRTLTYTVDTQGNVAIIAGDVSQRELSKLLKTNGYTSSTTDRADSADFKQTHGRDIAQKTKAPDQTRHLKGEEQHAQPLGSLNNNGHKFHGFDQNQASSETGHRNRQPTGDKTALQPNGGDIAGGKNHERKLHSDHNQPSTEAGHGPALHAGDKGTKPNLNGSDQTWLFPHANTNDLVRPNHMHKGLDAHKTPDAKKGQISFGHYDLNHLGTRGSFDSKTDNRVAPTGRPDFNAMDGAQRANYLKRSTDIFGHAADETGNRIPHHDRFGQPAHNFGHHPDGRDPTGSGHPDHIHNFHNFDHMHRGEYTGPRGEHAGFHHHEGGAEKITYDRRVMHSRTIISRNTVTTTTPGQPGTAGTQGQAAVAATPAKTYKSTSSSKFNWRTAAAGAVAGGLAGGIAFSMPIEDVWGAITGSKRPDQVSVTVTPYFSKDPN